MRTIRRFGVSVRRTLALLLCAVLLAGCAGGEDTSRATSDRTKEEVTGGASTTIPATDTTTASTAASTAEEEEPAEEEKKFAGFPAPGEVVEGFTLQEVREFDILGAEVGFFAHEESGAKLMYIHNDDVNRVFDLSFMTHSIDDTGLPHVFEHATLNGSRKYPSENLFFNLMYQSYMTFMNAFTQDRLTSYPLASLSEEQLLAVADYYTDSCFYPMIMKNESIYREEAWRYRLADPEGELTIEGTVYSEMQGGTTKSEEAMRNAIRTSLPGSSICYSYGGDPAFIPDMTWDMLKDYHNDFYVPSNCIAVLYGDIVEYEKFLALLDEAFTGYDASWGEEEEGAQDSAEAASTAAEDSADTGASAAATEENTSDGTSVAATAASSADEPATSATEGSGADASVGPATGATASEETSTPEDSADTGASTPEDSADGAASTAADAASSEAAEEGGEEAPAEPWFVEENYTRIEKAVVTELPFPVEEGATTDHASIVYYSFVCPDMNTEQQLQTTMMLSLLASEASALSQNLKQEFPTGVFGCAMEIAGPDMLPMFWIENVEREDAARFKEIVDEALLGLKEDGFPADLIDGVMATQSLTNRLLRESGDVGVNVAVNMAYYYSVYGNPFGVIDQYAAVDQMPQWNEDGAYGDIVEAFFEENARTTLVTTYPEPGLKEKNDAALKEKLAAVKAAMSEEEINALVAATKEEDAEEAETEEEAETDEETENFVKQLSVVGVSELPEEVREYALSDETGEDGIRRMNATASVDGVGSTALLLDAQSVAEEDLHRLMLLTQLTSYLDTTKHTRAELDTLSTRYLYSPSVSVTVVPEEENAHPYLQMSFIAADEDLQTAYELMGELVFDLKIDDAENLAKSVTAIRTSLRSSINAMPFNTVQLYRGFAPFNEWIALSSFLNGLEYYSFLEDTEARLTDEADAVIAELSAVQEQMHNRTGAIALFAGNEQSIAQNEDILAAFLEDFETEEREKAALDLVIPELSEGLIVESAINYNAVFAGFEEMGLQDGFHGGMNVVSALVTDQFLLPRLRDQYGVYSAEAAFLRGIGAILLTANDPNIAETFAVYEELPAFLENLEIDQETLDGYIMSSYVTYARPAGELTGAMQALNNALQNIGTQDMLDAMRAIKEMTPDDVKAFSEAYAKMLQSGARSTTGSAAAITEEEERYEAVYNPFGASGEAVETAFEDVPEDHPLYEYVTKIVTMGMMEPVEEGRFGVDEPATVGEFAYILMGGMQGAEESLATVQTLGMLAGKKADDHLTAKDIEDTITALAKMQGQEMQEDINWDDYVAGEHVTRGELARIITEE